MALNEKYVYECDECEDFEWGDTPEEARAAALERDWELGQSIDLCGRCREDG